MDKTEITYNDINLNNLVKSSVAMLKEAAEIKSLSLNFEPYNGDLIIQSDEVIINKILSNLLQNAIKFTLEGSISVRLNKETAGDREYALLSVSDTGNGISVDDQKIVFNEFSQEGNSRNLQGTGLGLTAIKKYVDLLNGFIFLKSAKGFGSTFYVYLPVKADSKTEIEIKQANKPDAFYSINGKHNLVRPKILLVENDDIVISITKIYMKNFYELDVAKTVQSTLLLTEKNYYDLILMDIHLADIMDGTDLTRILRNTSKYKVIPIIAFTAFAMESEKESFLASGCTDFISKPFTKEELYSKINENLNKKFGG